MFLTFECRWDKETILGASPKLAALVPRQLTHLYLDTTFNGLNKRESVIEKLGLTKEIPSKMLDSTFLLSSE